MQGRIRRDAQQVNPSLAQQSRNLLEEPFRGHEGFFLQD